MSLSPLTQLHSYSQPAHIHHPFLAFAIPFLPIKEGFHPKRNQARQKLATLPLARFEDLSSDVHFEIARRYPDFKEDVHTMLAGFPSPLPVSRARI